MPRRPTLWEREEEDERDFYAMMAEEQPRNNSNRNSNYSNYSNNNRNAQMNAMNINRGPINVPEGTRNEISMNNIEEGNNLVNFRGTGPKFESEFGYFYKPTTFSNLTQHPRTREPIQNYRRHTAHIVPKKNNKPNGSPKARKSRKNRKSRRTSRK